MFPTMDPSESPTRTPTDVPSTSPTLPLTDSPSANPTEIPTMAPTGILSADPTLSPSTQPTMDPTMDPTDAPTTQPKEIAGYLLMDKKFGYFSRFGKISNTCDQKGDIMSCVVNLNQVSVGTACEGGEALMKIVIDC